MADSSTAADAASATVAPDSFAPILPAAVVAALIGVSATAPTEAGSEEAEAPLSKSDFVAVGQFLFAALNVLFDAYPLLDELGLIAGMPSMGGRSAPASSRVLTDEVELASFLAAHPAPAAFLKLQAANASPPFVVLESAKLGISFWAVPFLVKRAQAAFHEARRLVKGLTQADLLELARKPLTADSAMPLHTAVLQCTRVLLLVNADHYTAWNMRKLLLSAGPITEATADTPARFILAPATELRLLNLIYSKHPKSSESWNHRRWVLSFIQGFDSRYHFMAQANQLHATREKHSIASIGLEAPVVEGAPPTSLYNTALFQREVRMCERSCELYPKNYYAWMHRQWMVERIDARPDLLSELARVGEWTESHINDYCGFFHRQVCWNHYLQLLARNTTFDTKALQEARVHANLAQQLRSWSKNYPATTQSDLPSTSSSAAAVPSSPSSPLSPSPVAAAPSSSSSSLHSALASCSFCSTFSSTEWSHLNDLQLRYPGHETLWMYRRFVWHAAITAIHQHDTETQPSSTTVAPTIPSWLQPLIHRELEYAEFQIDDRDLANYAANRTFATIYKVWVLHAALTLVYLAHDRRPDAAVPAAATSDDLPASSPTFPLFPSLSAQHRAWYLRLIAAVAQLQPRVMSHQHWDQRAQALTA